MKCYECPSYKRGRGTQRCLSCDEFKSSTIMGRYKPCVDYVKIPRMILENLVLDMEIDYYSKLDPFEATMLFMKYHLNLDNLTIAKLLNISEKTVRRKNKYSLMILSTCTLNQN
jgi:hypothetical protein